MNKITAVADARIKTHHIHRYVPHYRPSVQQQTILSDQIVKKIPTELRYVERSVFKNGVNNQYLRNFELSSHESMNFPIPIIIGFQQRDRQDSQNLNSDSFYRLPVISRKAIIGTERYPDS